MVDGEGRERMNPKMSARRSARRSDLGFHSFDGTKNVPRAFKIDFSLLGQCETPRGAIYKSHTKSKLQPRDELRDRGGRQADILGCASKASALDHTLENVHFIGGTD